METILPFRCVDAGARGGWKDLPGLADQTYYIAFEPEPIAFENLKYDLAPLGFYGMELCPFALWSEPGKLNLHISARPSMSSLLPFDPEKFDQHFGSMRDSGAWKKGLQPEKQMEVDAITLDEFFSLRTVHLIDYLKLDTQGSEMEILYGANRLLSQKNISVLKVEVSFQPVYAGQPSFSELDLFLKSKGFEFIDCQFHPEGLDLRDIRNHEKPKLFSGGDAFYKLPAASILELHGRDALVRQSIILGHLGYRSEAAYQLSAANFTEPEIKSLLPGPFKKNFSAKEITRLVTPPILLRLFKRIF